jgi:hypothetical protein
VAQAVVVDFVVVDVCAPAVPEPSLRDCAAEELDVCADAVPEPP